MLPLLYLILLAPPSLLQQRDLGGVLCQLCRLEGRAPRFLEPAWQSPLVTPHSPTRTNGLPGDEFCPLLLHGQGTLLCTSLCVCGGLGTHIHLPD